MNPHCDTCNIIFDSVRKLSAHNRDVHVGMVKVNFDNETLSISRTDSKFACPKCPSKLSTPATFNQHLMKKHNGRCSSVSNKRKWSEADNTDSTIDNSDSNKQGMLITVRLPDKRVPRLNINEQDSSSSPTVNPHLSEYDISVLKTTGTLNRPEAEQKGILVFLLVMGFKPVILKTEDGEEICTLMTQENIDVIIEKESLRITSISRL